ncbi:MAG: hypothetical protein JST89_08400 [Cyanobacteria bacterium SZAS-4]|nr:hypothetical protein [Cyanobacteria bacterium SZAS-4]
MYGSGLWHRFINKTKGKSKVFDINVNGLAVYWRLGLEGTKCATKRIQHVSEDEALQTMLKMIAEKEAEGFEHQHSLM